MMRKNPCPRRDGLSLHLRLMLVVLAAMGTSIIAAAAAPPRNVLFIVVDDLNTALGCYGDPLAKTPNIDRLAARGVRFDQASCQYPLCNPSRVSFLSGRRPESTGVYVLSTSARKAMPEAVMLPQFFRQQGYFTVGAGKIFHNAQGSDPASWDRYADGDGDDPQEKQAIKDRYGKGDGRPAWTVLDGDGTKTRDGITASTISGLLADRKADAPPFFFAAGFHKPHLPWTAPKRFFDMYREKDFERASEQAIKGIPAIALQTELSGFAQPDSPAGARLAYYACVSFTDHQVGLLLDELDRHDLWRNTIVVFFSDHGFHLGDHGGLWAKLSAFNAAIRVPLIIAGPGVPAGRTVKSPVELIDLYPTLVAMAGLQPPKGLDGRSLVKSWQKGGAADAPAYSLVFHYDVAHKRDVMGRSVIMGASRYTTWDNGAQGREFYNWSADPGEYVNRVDDPAEQALVAQGEALLKMIPEPKPGHAQRPRALLPPKGKK
ncbi:MAG: sulfatase [Opitutaceae bacterium]|nr:sulfatase [Opitutaceae bacterium]